jgi:stress response protein SCP2
MSLAPETLSGEELTMAKQLIRGQKVRFADFTSSSELMVEAHLLIPGAGDVDIACFGVDDQNRLTDDRYFVFYNQLSSPDGAIRKLTTADVGLASFSINLALLPTHVTRLAFTAAIDGVGEMSQLPQGYIRVADQQDELLRFTFAGKDFTTEKAIIIAEVYRKDIWRFSAVGQGFAGGLSALLAYYGGNEITPSSESTSIPAVRPLIELFQKPTLHNLSEDKARNQVTLCS